LPRLCLAVILGVDVDCKFYCYRKTETGSDVYIRSAERDENRDNPLTHPLDPNPILVLQCYYITSEGSVNTPFMVVVSLLLNSTDTIPIRPTTNHVLCPQYTHAEINLRRWHNYIELNRDESISAAGFPSLGERE